MRDAYREDAPPPALRSLVACTWEQTTGSPRSQLVVPDGCVDLIWLDREVVFAGADTGPRRAELPAGLRVCGVRLRPGAAGAVLGIPASDIRDRQPTAAEIWGDGGERLRCALAAAEPAERAGILAGAVAARRADPDPLVAAASRRLLEPDARVSRVARELGVGERRLRRRTLATVGYGPKTLARVARLRRLVALGDGPLAARALDAGYASQSHMSDEVARLTGLTAVRFLEDAAPTAA